MLKRTLKLIRLLCLLSMVVLIGTIWTELKSTKAVVETNMALQEQLQNAEPDEDWSNGLRGINPDYIGWLTVDGTTVDVPVVQGKDNTEYLTHNFYGEMDKHGAVFADSRLSEQQDLVLYGHNMKDSTMFGDLDQMVRSSTFFDNHGGLLWLDKAGEHWYRIFCVAVIPGSLTQDGSIDPLRLAQAVTEEDYAENMKLLRRRASIWRPTVHYMGARYLYLVTCDYTHANGRLLIAAQEVTNG